MKKIAILLSLTASFFMFAGCVSKATEQTAPAETSAAAHKNFKGEVGGDK